MALEKTGTNKRDLPQDQPVKVSVNGIDIVLVSHAGEVTALGSTCTHEEGPLDQGYIDGNELVCPLHSAAFDLKSGKANEGTHWATDIKSHRVVVGDDGEIAVEL